MSDKVHFTKSPDNKGVWFQTPFHEAWLADIKLCIPGDQRTWSNKLRMWWVSTRYARKAFELCQTHFGGTHCYHAPERRVPNRFEQFVDDPQPRKRSKKKTQGRRKKKPRSSRGGAWGGRQQRRPWTPPPSPLTEAYRALQIAEGAPWELVKAAHKALARVHHPDLGGDGEKMKAVNSAFDTLRTAFNKR